MKKHRGWTLVELLIVISIMGILSVGVHLIWGNVQVAAAEKDARSKAMAINAAKIGYSIKTNEAETAWAECTTDAQKYALLRSSNQLPMSPPTFSGSDDSFVPKRTTMTLGNLDERTKVYSADGTELKY